MDIRTLLLHIRDNPSNRGVATDTGVDRRTVQRYRQWAQAQGLLDGPLPPLEQLHRCTASSAPWTPACRR